MHTIDWIVVALILLIGLLSITEDKIFEKELSFEIDSHQAQLYKIIGTEINKTLNLLISLLIGLFMAQIALVLLAKISLYFLH